MAPARFIPGKWGLCEKCGMRKERLTTALVNETYEIKELQICKKCFEELYGNKEDSQ